MSRWPEVALGEVLTSTTRPEPVDPTAEYSLLGVRLEGAGPFLRETRIGAELSASSLSRVHAGDFIYSRLFAWRGAFGVVPPELDGCWVSNEFPTFRPVDDRIDPHYLGLWFRLPQVVDRVAADCTGSTPLTRNRYKEQFFLKLEVPLPPIEEQRRVVDKLNRLAALITWASRARQQVLDRTLLAPGCLRRLVFKRLGASAPAARLGDICDIVGGSGFPRSSQGRSDLAIPVVKVSDMNLPGNETLMTRTASTVDRETAAGLGMRICPPGTVVFPKIGGAIATNKRRKLGVDAAFDNNVMGVIPADGLVPDYLYQFMQSIDLTQLQAGTSLPAVSQKKVAELVVPMPPPAAQAKIAERLAVFETASKMVAKDVEAAKTEMAALQEAVVNAVFA